MPRPSYHNMKPNPESDNPMSYDRRRPQTRSGSNGARPITNQGGRHMVTKEDYLLVPKIMVGGDSSINNTSNTSLVSDTFKRPSTKGIPNKSLDKQDMFSQKIAESGESSPPARLSLIKGPGGGRKQKNYHKNEMESIEEEDE
jgi:hypothetical protein